MKIGVYAAASLKKKVEAGLQKLKLTGYEQTDRILISDYLDGIKGKVSISYDGNTVYPLKKYLNGLLKMEKTGRLDLTDEMYHFLSLNFDIAHYDKAGFEAAYDNSWCKWYQSQHREFDRIPGWRSDLRRIVDEFNKSLKHGSNDLDGDGDQHKAQVPHDPPCTAKKKVVKIYDGQMTLTSFLTA